MIQHTHHTMRACEINYKDVTLKIVNITFQYNNKSSNVLHRHIKRILIQCVMLHCTSLAPTLKSQQTGFMQRLFQPTSSLQEVPLSASLHNPNLGI
jgi:hypothetical protein